MGMVDDIDTSSRLGSRLRGGLALAQTRIHTIEEQAKNQWEGLPAQARATLNRMLARLRTSLDLPSRSELVGLVERIEELDRKLDALEHRQRLTAGSPTNGESAKADSTAEVTEQAAGEAEAATQEAMQAAREAEAAAQEAMQAAREAEAAPREAAGEAQDEAGETAPASEGQSKKNGTHTKKARRTSAGKTLTAGGKNKSATTGKRQGKDRATKASDKRK